MLRVLEAFVRSLYGAKACATAAPTDPAALLQLCDDIYASVGLRLTAADFEENNLKRALAKLSVSSSKVIASYGPSG